MFMCNAIYSTNELLKVKGNLETWKRVSETLVVALPRMERLNVRVRHRMRSDDGKHECVFWRTIIASNLEWQIRQTVLKNPQVQV